MKMLEQKSSLSRLNVLSLAFGSIIGWGAFVMPASSFLPSAGPVGTVIAVVLGVAVMCLFAVNFQYMMNRFPSNGGPFIFTVRTYGYGHAFVCSWFLGMAYISQIPLNATALMMICRMLPGKPLQIVYLYRFAGYDIYLGELIVAALLIVLIGVICSRGGRLVGMIQTLLALILLLGVIVICGAAFISDRSTVAHISPGFAENGRSSFTQVLMVFATMPWAFVGFESISLTVERFRFPVKRSLRLMIAAILLGGGIYVTTTLVTASTLPEGYDSWLTYLAHTGNFDGLQQIPLFHAAYQLMGDPGIWILAASAVAAVLTGLIGFFLAASRLLSAMADKRILPEWFRRGGELNPRNVIIFIALVSATGPFFGRTFLGWIVDVSSLGAAVGFGYTSIASIREAKKDGSTGRKVCGIIGLLLAIFFACILLVPTPLLGGTVLKWESYLILGVWVVLGAVFYFLFRRKSAVVIGEDATRLALHGKKPESMATDGVTPDEKKWEFKGRRALLVDDNRINREITKGVLERFGFEVIEASDGDEAVVAVEVSAEGEYDIILMDIQMPRMDGHEATRMIRDLENPALARIPIVALTAQAIDEDVKKAEEAGMDAHIAKPIDISALMKTITDLIGDREDV